MAFGNKDNWQNAFNNLIYDATQPLKLSFGVVSVVESLDPFLKTGQIEIVDIVSAIATDAFLPIYLEGFDKILSGIVSLITKYEV